MATAKKTKENLSDMTDIGLLLKTAREEEGLTQEQVAEKLRLKAEYVQLLETDAQIELQKNPIFTRGYLRGYARLVNIPNQQIDEILATYVVEEPTPLKGAVINKKNPEFSFRDKKIRWLTYGLGALLLVLIIIWWRSQVVNHVPNTVATPTVQQSTTEVQQPLPMIEKQIQAEKENQNKTQEKKEHPAHPHQQQSSVNKLNIDMQG